MSEPESPLVGSSGPHPPEPDLPATIGQVVERLREIVDAAREEQSPLGYFPALYRQVTVRVAEGIEHGEFDDGKWLERLDVVFANRYLEAYDRFRAGGAPAGSWACAFRVAGEWWPIVLQHLLLGINAHINLDLGIATAQTVESPAELGRRRADFDRINHLLASLVGGVKQSLATIWTTLRLFSGRLGGVDDAIINFSLGEARAGAWRSAQRFAALERERWPAEIARRDQRVVRVAGLVRHPGVVGTAVNHVVRLGERGDPAAKIRILAGTGARVAARVRLR